MKDFTWMRIVNLHDSVAARPAEAVACSNEIIPRPPPARASAADDKPISSNLVQSASTETECTRADFHWN